MTSTIEDANTGLRVFASRAISRRETIEVYYCLFLITELPKQLSVKKYGEGNRVVSKEKFH